MTSAVALAAASAINAGIYVSGHNAVSLGCAVFAGLLSVAVAVRP